MGMMGLFRGEFRSPDNCPETGKREHPHLRDAQHFSSQMAEPRLPWGPDNTSVSPAGAVESNGVIHVIV